MSTLIAKPLSPALGAEIIGGDYTKPLNQNDIIFLKQNFLKYHLLCLRSKILTAQQLYKVASYLGEPFSEVTRNHWDKGTPEISILDSTYKSEKDKPKDPKLNRRSGWHTDHSFKKYPPKATILHGHKIPSFGGHTRFCNTRKAYEDLSNIKIKQLQKLKAVHAYDTIRAPAEAVKRTPQEIEDTPDVIHPLIKTHSETNKKSIYFNSNRTDSIVGYARKDSDDLLDEVHNHLIQKKYRYDHMWKIGDIVIWDNRCLIHSVNVDYPIGEPRIHLRTLLKDDNL